MLFEEEAKMLELKKEEHVRLKESRPFQEEINFLHSITLDFIYGLWVTRLMSTRAPRIYNEFLVFRNLDEYIESAIGIEMLIKEGIINLGRRELRYLLESIVKYYKADMTVQEGSLRDKIIFLRNEIPNSSIDIVSDINIGGLAGLASNFKNEIKDTFIKSCAYVHPSESQIKERLSNYEKGNTIGFESITQIRKMNRLLFRVYDMILVIVFNDLGLGLAGDIFVGVLDENRDWKYHKGKYISVLSSFFDYKVERKK